jgi:hypothetical protein
MGAICLPACATDADCKALEGTACDRARKACATPRVRIAPQPPACTAEPLAKKSFGPAQQISWPKGPGRYHFEPTAALGKDGGVIAAYTTNGLLGDKNVLATARISKDGAIVSTDLPFPSDRENQFDPWIAADTAGRAYLVWLGFDGGHAPEKRMEIGLSTSDDGRTWSKPRPIHDEVDCPNAMPGCLDKPMIVIGPAKGAPKKEAIYVFYFSEAAEGLRVRRSLDRGATFSKSVPVGAGAYGDAFVDANGDLHVVYANFTVEKDRRPELFGDAHSHVEYVKSTDGGATFSKPITVSEKDELVPFFYSNPQVRFDVAKKRLAIVYPKGGPDLRWDLVLAVSKDGGSTFERSRVNDDAPCAHHMTPSIAFDRERGLLHVAWIENRSGRGAVAYTTCDPSALRCEKNEAVSDAPFAAYELVRHDSRWLGEYFPLLLDPKTRRLHLLWTETVDENGLAVSRIFYAKAH